LKLGYALYHIHSAHLNLKSESYLIPSKEGRLKKISSEIIS